MQAVEVSGRFINEQGQPITDQTIRFVPNKIWVEEEDGTAYPTFAPEVALDSQGAFSVTLSRTDTAELPWHYTVFCPVGQWTIRVEEDGPVRLKQLLPKRFA